MQSSFRYDINGLRAIAVLAVVIYHFVPKFLIGGFSGVDIFFVISGFLMTSIIIKGLGDRNFNLFKFYVARANRIIPALAVLCLTLLILGWFFLPPIEYKSLGKHVAGSLSFLSNIFYWKESGYFDASSHEKWLLHTWSLSAEWQFYIIYPAILLLLNKFLSIAKIKKIILISFIIFFIFNIYLSIKNPTAAYYLLPSRVWEMLLGGIAFLYPISMKKTTSRTLNYFGIFLIIISFFIISSNNYWPGYLALIPTLGVFLVIISNYKDSFLAKSVFFQKIGLWSYSIYLWHWPLVVIGYFYNINYWFVIGFPLSIILGLLSYQLIESKKFLSYEKWKDVLKVKPVLIVLFVGGFGTLVFSTKGFEYTYPENVRLSSMEVNNKNPYNCLIGEEDKISDLPYCYIGNKNNIKAIIVGDSHADAITTSISSIYNLKKEGVLAITRASCPFVLNAKNNKLDDTCYKENFKKIIALKNFRDTPIIISGRWSVYIHGQSDPQRIVNNENNALMYFGNNKYMGHQALLDSFSKNLTKTLCELSINNNVYITQPIPEMGQNIPKNMSRLQMLGYKNVDLSLPSFKYYEKNASIRAIITDSAKKCGATVLDPAEYLCTQGKCIAQLNNRPIYQDGDHLSEYGNRLLTPLFNNALNPL